MKVGLLVELHKDFENDIKHAKELGFDFGQLVNWDMELYTDENLQKLKNVLEKYQFTVTDFWCGWSGEIKWGYPDKHLTLGLVPKKYRAQRLEDLRRGAEFAYKLGIKNIVTHTGFIPDNPFAEEHIGVVESLKVLCKELKERGQNFTFETGEELPVTLGLLMSEVGYDNMGVNFDPANLLTGGRANPNDAMDLLGSRVMGMHAKDSIPPVLGKPNGKQVPIGEGKVDFERLFRQLKDIGYQGDIVIEHEMAGRENRDEDIRRAKIYLETLIIKVFGEVK